jgi:hypothetical protein
MNQALYAHMNNKRKMKKKMSLQKCNGEKDREDCPSPPRAIHPDGSCRLRALKEDEGEEGQSERVGAVCRCGRRGLL